MKQFARGEIERYLERYLMMKAKIEFRFRDLDEMLEQRAASVETGRTGLQIKSGARQKGGTDKKGRIIWKVIEQLIDEEAPMFFHSPGTTSDPTAAKAILLDKCKRQLQRDNNFQFECHVVEAVEKTINSIKERQKFGTERQKEDAVLQEKMIIERYFEGKLKDSEVWMKLKIPERTYYKWKNDILDSLAVNLQFLCSKVAV